MAHRLPTPPSPQDLAKALNALLREFDPRTTSFPDPTGRWREAPATLQDRIVHHLLFHLTQLGPEVLSELQAQAFASFLNLEAWPGILVLAETSSASSTGLGFIRGLARLLQAETLRFQSEQPAASWNSKEKRRRQEVQVRHRNEEADLDRLLGQNIRQMLLDLLGRSGPSASSFFGSIIRLAAEEDALFHELKILQERMLEPAGGDEAAACLLEKIQPPMGIVTNTSPSLLLPCLNLLADTGLKIESGIPFAASVILSILRDPRSSSGLLHALERFPLSCSKLRENIIYTLGCLGQDKAVPLLAAVLQEADEVPAVPMSAEGRVRSLVEQKVEAIWALGKMGPASFSVIPILALYADHPSSSLQTTLAWTLGEIGRAQKEKLGGLDADLVIALLKLLKTKNRQVFEEAVGALRRIDLPEFIHSLYLYHAGAVSLQSLLPAQRGLYELSETLHFLIKTKGRAIMAVNGDSGTGKTFFCQAIAGGFGDLKSQDILYLMRDRKSGQKVCNRILGLSWLKKNIDPAYYYDYPLSEEEDDPEAFFEQFSYEHRNKKLIILDGCRDKYYFQRVIDFFYQKGFLDVEVTFRATFSSRRLNLEEREIALEGVKTHLSFQEEPILEDTPFYREGIVLLYDLDNSIGSRLDRDETRELFDRQKIDSWGDFIRLGSFEKGKKFGEVRTADLDIRRESRTLEDAAWAAGHPHGFRQEERHLRARLNEDVEAEPNLLQTFDLEDLAADRLRFYAQNQVAGTAEDGQVFVFSFIDNRLFRTRLDKIQGLTLMGRELYTLTPDGGLAEISFERNEVTRLGPRPAAALALASYGREQLITGHEDGTICIWNLAHKSSRLFRAGPKAITAAAADQRGRLCAGTADGLFLRFDPDSGGTEILEFPGRTVALIKPYLRDKVLVVSRPRGVATGEPDSLFQILDLENRTSGLIPLPEGVRLASINVYFDGRIIAGLSRPRKPAGFSGPNLLILELGQETFTASGLAGQAGGIKDCLTMGPRIISCGLEENGQTTLRVWGTEFYVRTELSKLAVRSVWPQ
jgi:hypothetical protein